MAELLRIEGLKKGYTRGGWAPVFVDVSLEVVRGEIVAVIGGRLEGKTTLLKIAAGVERPDSGTVSLIDQSFSRSRGSWSVPCIGDGRGRWQPATWGNLPEKLLAAAERLSGVALENGDALEIIPRWDREDAVIYCDPPYIPGSIVSAALAAAAGGSTATVSMTTRTCGPLS